MKFELDARLAADTILLQELQLSELRLMNDSRWPWLILVPKKNGVSELFELDEDEQRLLNEEIRVVAQALKKTTGCAKINIAAIGNIVRQLHIHVIARNENDANWPGPVWGFGQKTFYVDDEINAFSARLIEVLG